MRGGSIGRGLTAVVGVLGLALAVAAPAHAVATVAADTTRSLIRDPLSSGRSPSLVAGGLDRALLRFDVRGLGGPPARAVLRLRVTDPTIETLAVRALPPAFGEDDGLPSLLLPELLPVARVLGAQARTWAEWDVTAAVGGDGDVGLQVSGPLLDPASFSSREGPDAPQLVLTPDDGAAVRLTGLLDPQAAETFVADARDDLGRSLDGLDVIEAPPGQGVPGRYIGVHHSLIGARYVTQVATSDDLTTWTHRADVDSHASQATLEALPDGGFVLAFERDTPDAQYISRSNLVVRHYAGWAALAAGTFDRQVDLPRTLAPTAEGTPALSVTRWNGPGDSQIAVTFHYLKNIDVDRQAAGVLTNFSAAGWAPQPDAAVNGHFIRLGTRGNLGDRADLSFEGRPFTIFEAQSIKADFGTWRWYLYDRERSEARLLALHAPAGSFALGNPTVRALTGPDGRPLLLVSGFAFSEGAAPGEAGQFIALRRASTAPAANAEALSASPSVAAALAGPPAAAMPAPAADSTPPTARLIARAQRLARTIASSIACTDEACRATTTGTVRVPLRGAPARTYRLPASTTTIAKGATATVRLALSPAAAAAIRRALETGRRPVVSLRADVADGAGNARTLTQRIGLRL